MSDPFQDSIEVEHSGTKYTFKIPGILVDLEIGGRAADIRRRAYPAGGGAIVDTNAAYFSRAAAVMELYLTAATATWPFSAGEDGKPRVDVTKFPLEQVDAVYDIGNAFDAELARFRKPRAPVAAPPAA